MRAKALLPEAIKGAGAKHLINNASRLLASSCVCDLSNTHLYI